MALAHLSVGANLGARVRTCLRALEKVAALDGTRVCARSRLYESEPQGISDQPLFVNLAAEIETDRSPEELLAAFKGIEQALGREPAERWGPRAIDLDLLLYDDLVLDSPELTIPHPRMHERRFVLAPMAEIAPDLRHPVLGRSMAELLQDLGGTGGWVRPL